MTPDLSLVAGRVGYQDLLPDQANCPGRVPLPVYRRNGAPLKVQAPGVPARSPEFSAYAPARPFVSGYMPSLLGRLDNHVTAVNR